MEELLLQRDEATRNRLRQAQDFLDPRMPLDLVPAPPSPPLVGSWHVWLLTPSILDRR